MQDRQFSFEFFPPKTAEGAEKLRNTRAQLSPLKPRFISVTFGAGGTTQQGTLDAVVEIQREGIEAAPHLSCVGSSRESIRGILNTYREHGIRRIVALRGDMPSGMGEIGEFRFANELVEFIRQETGEAFHIEVAAYPEYHPQSRSARHDLENFARKVKAGADSAITQYFFNPDSYFHFVDEVHKRGVTIPVIPGIMPITHFANLVRFSDACGAEIPRWIRKQAASFGDDTASLQKFGEEVVTDLCRQLLQGGAPGLHFYTMNQAEPTLALWRNLGLPE